MYLYLKPRPSSLSEDGTIAWMLMSLSVRNLWPRRAGTGCDSPLEIQFLCQAQINCGRKPAIQRPQRRRFVHENRCSGSNSGHVSFVFCMDIVGDWRQWGSTDIQTEQKSLTQGFNKT